MVKKKEKRKGKKEKEMGMTTYCAADVITKKMNTVS